ncbi:MAG: CocE/NonD family hydrolase [Candidatus Acetothermia bacterium]
MSETNGDDRTLDIIWDARVEMEDGVELSSDVYLPDSEDSFPAVLIRTPYNKSRGDEIKHGTRDVEFFVNHGYAVVIQDVRGRGDSEGEWIPFVNEGKDGYQTIEWIAKQSWCNGKVGMMGGSYRGFVQWAAARENPAPLTTMISTAAAGRWFQEIPFINGTVTLTGLEWLNFTGGRTVQDPDLINWEEVLWHLPLKSMDKRLGRDNTVWKEWLTHSTLDDYWKSLLLTDEDFSRIDLPVLHITGWYDGDQAGATYFYQGMKESSPAREDQYLISGPWDHSGTRIPRPELGGVDFTEDSLLNLKKIHKLWFDAQLKNREESWQELRDFYRGKNSTTFVMGRNEWERRNKWPPEVEREPWYFRSDGNANTLRGDGELRQKPSPGGVDKYIYDPENPVISDVDFNFYSSSHVESSLDQRFIERRDDVLVYTSEILQKEVHIAGRPEIFLYASSDQVDTDWIVFISDVYPNGRSIKITEGYLRARYRESLEEQKLLEPGRVYEFSFEMNYEVNNSFLPGHRIRVSVTSSYFPRLSRNPNTGADIGEGEKTRPAVQQVYHDQEHPSRILLPRVGE